MKFDRTVKLAIPHLVLFFALILSGCGGTGASSAQAAAPATAIQNKGSDTMVNLALAWAEQYQKLHPEVSLSVTGGGTGTGIAALVNGTVDLANASRAMKPEEEQQARDKGYQPQGFVVARDAIAVIINPENPVTQLTLQQISQIYRGEINNWQELGGENRPIVRLSRETNSGTHVYFLETVVRLGNSKDKALMATNTLLLPSSEGIIAEVRDNPNAIGYDGLGYVTGEVKTVGVAKKPGDPYVMPSVESVNANTYPVARDLYMYTMNEPTGAIKDYLDWVRSAEGQDIVARLGFVPVATK